MNPFAEYYQRRRRLENPTPPEPPPTETDCLNPRCLDIEYHPGGCARKRTESMYFCCQICQDNLARNNNEKAANEAA